MADHPIRIVGICGSPRKMSTEYSLNVALAAAAEIAGVETELITLRNKKINFCIHCNKCIREESRTCAIYQDDMSGLYDAVYEADGFIIASPVYEMNITAQLAAFFNRFRPTYTILKNNPFYFSSKVGSAIAVGGTRNGGQESTIAAIHGFYHTQGIIPVNGAMGVYSGASVWSQDRGAEGAKDDLTGMENCRRIGLATAKLARTIRLGTKAVSLDE
jgi:multimeric flavodoxin WrbA